MKKLDKSAPLLLNHICGMIRDKFFGNVYIGRDEELR
jgi:hypothetical protein